jgi:hypothetical protein
MEHGNHQHQEAEAHPLELRERAVRTAKDLIAEQAGQRFGFVTRVARELGLGTESLPDWSQQAETDTAVGQSREPSGPPRVGVNNTEISKVARLRSRTFTRFPFRVHPQRPRTWPGW